MSLVLKLPGRNMILFSLEELLRKSLKIIFIELIDIRIWMFVDTVNNNICFIEIANLNKCGF